MSSRLIDMTPALYDYMVDAGVREHPVLAKLRVETAPMRTAGMQISPDQGAFMQLLVKLLGARRSLEIGVFTGYSSLSVALALPDDGELIACDVSEEWTGIARRYWAEAGVAHKIRLELRPATETLDALIAAGNAGKFDFAFIDADKANYAAYYERALVLLRAGGLIAVDNVLWSGAVLDASRQDEDTKAIRAINAAIRTDARVDVVMLSVGDGLTLARKR